MFNPLKILIADDSPTLLNVAKFILNEAGYEVVTAQNGIEALEKIYEESPDLIILDIIMPKMTGYQVCRILKNDKETMNIPLILLTAQDQVKDKFWGLKTGADKYITKTKDLEQELVSEVRFLLEKFSDLPHQKLSLRKIDNLEIISLVNSLLDKQLFESTIINEVSNIAISAQEYHLIINELLLLFNKLINYHIGVLLLIDDKESEFWIRSNIAIDNEFVKIIQQKVSDEIKDKINSSSMINAHIINEKDEYYEPDESLDSIDEIQSYYFKVLNLHNECIGVFALFSKFPKKFNSEAINTCNIVLNQGLILIENAKLYKKTQELAVTDGLTKVYNHRYFQEQLEKELNRTIRYGHYLSIIMIDIDHFKHFNDAYGHQSGDVVLKEISRLLQNNLRNVETVARYGGEEFIIVLPETNSENAARIAERLCSKVEANKFTIKNDYPNEKITISLGMASYPEDANTKAELIAKADAYLYQAKESGRNRVCSISHSNKPKAG